MRPTVTALAAAITPTMPCLRAGTAHADPTCSGRVDFAHYTLRTLPEEFR